MTGLWGMHLVRIRCFTMVLHAKPNCLMKEPNIYFIKHSPITWHTSRLSFTTVLYRVWAWWSIIHFYFFISWFCWVILILYDVMYLIKLYIIILKWNPLFYCNVLMSHRYNWKECNTKKKMLEAGIHVLHVDPLKRWSILHKSLPDSYRPSLILTTFIREILSTKASHHPVANNFSITNPARPTTMPSLILDHANLLCLCRKSSHTVVQC